MTVVVCARFFQSGNSVDYILLVWLIHVSVDEIQVFQAVILYCCNSCSVFFFVTLREDNAGRPVRFRPKWAPQHERFW